MFVVTKVWGYEKAAIYCKDRVEYPRALMAPIEEACQVQSGVRDNKVVYGVEIEGHTWYFWFIDFSCYIGREVTIRK